MTQGPKAQRSLFPQGGELCPRPSTLDQGTCCHTHLRWPLHRLQKEFHERLVVLGRQDPVLSEAHLQPQGTQAPPRWSRP